MTERPVSLDRHTVPVEGDLRLPKPPGVIRQFWYRHPRWTDSLIAGAYLALAVGGCLLLMSTPGWTGDPMLTPFGIAVLVLGALALLFRRSRPWTVLGVAWIVTLLAAPVWGTVDFGLIPLAVYALAVYASVRAAWVGFGGSVIVGFAATVVGDSMGRDSLVEPGSMTAGNVVSFAVFLLIVVLVGINIGNRRRYVVALLDRAAQLARERDQQAQLAAVTERSRIAREMHDIVSHGLTVMVTLAEGSAATAAAQPERASDAMRQVAETGRQALADMRRMLGVLDDGSPGADGTPHALQPQPGIAELGGLIERFRSAGLAVQFTAEGTPPADSAEQLTIYRLVQESLTNVLRHSPGAAGVRAAVRYGDADVAITVTNDGPLSETPVPADQREDKNGGHGILGMRERVALYGGTVDSGPRPGGGWAVTATLRHEPAPPPVAPPLHEWTPVQ
jgi:signal transduction histidine kinase